MNIILLLILFFIAVQIPSYSTETVDYEDEQDYITELNTVSEYDIVNEIRASASSGSSEISHHSHQSQISLILTFLLMLFKPQLLNYFNTARTNFIS